MENYLFYSIIAILSILLAYISASNNNDFSILFTKRKKLQILKRLFKQYEYKEIYISDAKIFLHMKKDNLPKIIKHNIDDPYDLSCAIVINANLKLQRFSENDIEIAKRIHENYHSYGFIDQDLICIANKILRRWSNDNRKTA